MTKKDFIHLADRIKAHNIIHKEAPYTELQLIDLAQFCATQNPRFDRERWMNYINGKCGPSGGQV